MKQLTLRRKACSYGHRAARFLTVFLFVPVIAGAQPAEMDQVKMVPSVDENNMRLITLCMWSLFDEAKRHPESVSTPRADSEVVHIYYDTEFQGKHEKLRAFNGRRYMCSDRKELDSNNRLMFNLRFDAYGSIVVPDTIYAISHRVEEREGKVAMLGLISIGLKVTDVVREKLSKARLERIVRSRAVVNGENPATEVIVPFTLGRRISSRVVTGHIWVDDGKVEVQADPNSSAGESASEVLKTLEEPLICKMLMYKKGEFNYEVEHVTLAYNIDLNIRRNTVWSSQQTKNFSIDTYSVAGLSGAGSGEHSKQYQNAAKEIKNKLSQLNKPARQ